MTRIALMSAVVLACLALAPIGAGPAAAAQRAASYPTVAPFVFSLIHPKMLVGRYQSNPAWKCVASDGFTAFIAYNTSRSRARSDLAAVGFPNAVCQHKR